jgi:hypothetical protein
LYITVEDTAGYCNTTGFLKIELGQVSKRKSWTADALEKEALRKGLRLRSRLDEDER